MQSTKEKLEAAKNELLYLETTDTMDFEEKQPLIEKQKELIKKLEAGRATNFFQLLNEIENLDLTLRIMSKNGKITINVQPGLRSLITQPMNVTGTPEELDAEFFETLLPEVNDVAGIISNIEEVKQEATNQKTKSEMSSAAKKADKGSGGKKKTEKKPEKKAEPAAAVIEEPKLFEE